jgi:uncharacterized phage protein (TIGR01671 family)
MKTQIQKREIKFRVWTGLKMDHNIMAGYLGAFYVQGLDEKDYASMSPFNTKYENNPLMQFTGLKDKNGKEIYEGDVITSSEKIILHGESPENMIVAWNDKFASFCLTKKGWLFDHYFHEAIEPRYCVVIGNIYENSELLKP